MNWYVEVLKKYAVFEGRARRKEYWMFVLFHVIVSIALALLANVASILGILYILYILATLVPAIAVTVRRLHDTDKSGWFVLIAFIPFVGGLILLVLNILEGTKGPNKFGADPKGEAPPPVPAA